MAEQFSASTAFTNMNNNTDGWGDDWGDWNDNSGPAVETTMPKTVGSMQTAPNAPPNTYFQPPQQQQPQQPQQHLQTQYQQPQPQMTPAPGTYLTGGQNRMDQHNHNYVPNYSQGNTGYQQPTMMPPTTANQYSTANYAQPSYDAPATNFFNAPPSHPAPAVPHPPASTTPQLIPTFSQTISDSFDTTASNNSWNWTVPEPPKHSQPTSGPKPQPNENVAPKQSPQQQQSAPVQQYEDFPQQGNLPSAASVQLQRLKAETLSPQWSIESQVSSSDRSLESDPSGDNRGPAQTTTTMRASEGTMNNGPFPAPAPTSLPAAVPDKLDEVLEALSIKQEPTESTAVAGNSQLESNYRGEQNFPPPPPSIVGTAAAAGPIVNDSLSLTSKTSSTTPPLPPPPIDNATIASSPASGPPMASGGTPPKAMQIAGSNPFKRTGPRSHTATPGLSGAGPSPAAVVPPSANAGGAFFYQQQTQHPALLQPAAVEEQHNIESLTPENQEILVETRSSEQTMENQEIAPNNDRNQYLQTGHLSEDGYGVEGTTSMSGNSRTLQATGSDEVETNHGDANDGRLPPPGLSRYVPGQNEQQPEPFVVSSVAVGQSFPEPPPGLDRMVPGMDLQNVSDLSLERQADGEVSDSTTPAAPPTIMPAASMAGPGARNDHLHHHHHHNHHHERRVDMSDRNLYRVPGEDDNHTHLNQQRVVPGGGTENDRPMPAPASSAVPVSSAASVMLNSVASLDMPEEQRELVMDGENPDDRREDSLVGGNADPIPSAAGAGSSAAVAASGAAALETESNVTVDSTYRMEPSNTSTADESDKGGFYGGAAGSSKGGRREDDNLRRSNKSKSSRDRYDTEDSDYSEHERRRRDRGETGVAVASGGAVAESSSSQRQERSRRTNGDREKDKQRKDNGRDRDRDRDRERDRDRDRDRDYYYRDRDRERNRYDRDRGERYGRNSKYDRDSRYETDGSKYETERSTRYEKEDRRYGSSTTRDDYYRKRDERGPTDDSRGGAAGRDRDRDRDTLERRQRKEKERSERYRGDERRKDDRYREGDKRRDRPDRRYDPEDYRAGSRNGTDRDRARDSRERDDRKEKDRSKYMGTGGSGYVGGAADAYGPSSGYYDSYSYYAQHQQYYEQLRRTNPQAYAEWYRTYYAQMQASQMQRDLRTTDGRESVHSGRSSANDKERFNRTTPFLHPPGVFIRPEDYHRHYNNQSLPSAAGAAGPGSLLDQSYLTDASGQPSSLPPMMYHAALQQQTQHHRQALLHHQQQRANTALALDRTYHGEAGGYFQPRIDQIDASSIKPETATELSMMEPERLTPRKFPEIHPIVSVSAGLLISTKNRLTMNGMADTVKIYSLGYSDASRKLFQTYPGPLVKGVTHKKSVIEFCEEQLRQGPPYGGALALMKSRGNSINSLHSSSLAAGVKGSSFSLLWNYIILLLRQNGTFVGTDISELLMRNKEEYPFESLQASVPRSANISGRNSSLSQAAAEREGDARHGEGDSEEAADASLGELAKDTLVAADAASPKPLSELEITDKFRSYLLYGNISEALEWATEHNLWGHALFLASKVDSRQHANVMMKFANKLTLNDPLQTLYQLLSGRTPASVTSVLDEKWGDWRPHLAMLMSNSSAKPELIKKSITTLGDTLLHRGDLYAAHFCYLLSDVAFGRFADVRHDVAGPGNSGTVRLVLLGAAHSNRTFRELSTNEAIMMTEVYEYARSLNEDRYSIDELQRYKYLLACRMLDQGMQLKCLLYMEQIAEQIRYDPYRFDTDFVRKVYTLGDRLKYYDPVMEKALDESVNNTGRGNVYANVEDPQWLKQLNEILLNNSSSGASQYNNVGDGPLAYDYGTGYGYGVEQSQRSVGGIATEEQVAVQQPETNDINEQFNEINQQLGQLNLQYSDQSAQQYQPNAAAPYELNPAPVPGSYDQGYESINQQSLIDPTVEQPAQQQQQQLQDNYEQQHQQYNPYSSYDEHQQQEQQQQQLGGTSYFTPAPPANSNEVMGSTVPTSYDAGYWGTAAGSNSELRAQEHHPQHYHADEEEEEHEMDEEDEDRKDDCDRSSLSPSPAIDATRQQAIAASFDYHRVTQQQLQQQRDACAAPKPTISMPNAVSKRPGYGDDTDDERTGGGARAGEMNATTGGSKPQQQAQNAAAQAKKAPGGKDGKGTAGPAGAQGSGWFGGIWNKFSLKPKNQMILPDDKNPKIVWDEVSKRWVNTDEGEAEAEAYKPPPKMSDLVPTAAPAPTAGPPAAVAPVGGPSGPIPQSQNSGGGPVYQQPLLSNPMDSRPQSQPMQSNVSAVSNAGGPVGEPTKVPTLQSNMYKMQRNRTLKRSYVDVFNPSGAAPTKPTEPVLAPAVPTMPNAAGSFFVPAGAPNTGGAEQQTEGAAQGMPQFYNPNQFAGGYQQQ